jgi:NADH-quinone oxidoreductase subunit F
MPRLRPPYPAEKGFWQKPTNINNVETFANVSYIISRGGKAYSENGTEKSAGTKVFALAGKINRGGLVEVPLGLPLREVIHRIGAGIRNGKQFKAIQMGGPSGGCLPAELIDTPVDYENIPATGAIIGSGGMVVMDEDTCMIEMARYFLNFICRESCGKCNYCRIGTKRMLEILERITNGDGVAGDIELLVELATKIMEGSLCGLGQTAPNPVLTTIKYFRAEYDDHIQNKHCTAHYCKPLISFSINETCTGCTRCKRECPVQAISGERKELHYIDSSLCTKCGRCQEVCRFDAVVRD